jgi:hypothetical protein
MNFETIVGCAGRLDRLQADKPTDAVIDMNDQIAGPERGDLVQHILGSPRPFAGAHQAVAQNVLFADHDQIRRLKSRLKAEHGDRDRVARQYLRLRQS